MLLFQLKHLIIPHLIFLIRTIRLVIILVDSGASACVVIATGTNTSIIDLAILGSLIGDARGKCQGKVKLVVRIFVEQSH